MVVISAITVFCGGAFVNKLKGNAAFWLVLSIVKSFE